MPREELVACMIMESVGEPTRPKNVEVFDKGGLFYLRFDTVLQEFDALNRNKRIYAGTPMQQSLNAPHLVELRAKKTWKGEAGHPLSNESQRILTIDPKLTSHKINSIQVNGNILHGQVETLDDNAYGTQFTKNILQGMEPAFSLRALARLTKRGDGTSLMNSPCHIVTYDWVILPSHVKAYRDTSKPIEKIYQSIQADGNVLTESNVAIAVMESQVKDFIAMESHNVKLVSSVYEVAMESMQLSANGDHVILREGSNTYQVKIEDHIKRETSRYMSKFM
ncbi:hypothetical protein D1872_38320 [compost metagenome]